MNVLTDPKASAYAEDSINIKAPVAIVFNLLANFSAWPSWFDGVTEMRMDGTPVPGATFTWKSRGRTMRSTIHTNENGAELGWTGKAGRLSATHNWTFQGQPDGSTQVTSTECYSGFLASRLRSSLLNDLRKDLRVLKVQSLKIAGAPGGRP